MCSIGQSFLWHNKFSGRFIFRLARGLGVKPPLSAVFCMCVGNIFLRMYISAGRFEWRIYVTFERRNLSRLFWLVKFLCLQIYYTPCIFIFICNDKRKIYGKIFTIIVENIDNSDIYMSASQIMCVECIRHVCGVCLGM